MMVNQNRTLAMQLHALNRNPQRSVTVHFAVVTAVNAGPPKTLTVNIDASPVSQTLRYASNYAPAVGDVAVVLDGGADPFVLCALS